MRNPQSEDPQSATRNPQSAVIFDLDGVLIDSEELQFQAYAEVLAGYGVTIGRAEYGREWITAGGGPEYAVRTYGLAVHPDTLRAMKEPVYDRLLAAHVRLMPGAMSALARLSAG